MTRYDFSPLVRSSIGFDRLARLAEAAQKTSGDGQTYPPYNIEQFGEEGYAITLAVAGFSEDELSIEVKDNTLSILGKKAREEGQRTYVYRGIAGRDFIRKFQLAEHVKVAGASLENGLLRIDLVCEIPEKMKPRLIKIDAVRRERTSATAKAKAA